MTQRGSAGQMRIPSARPGSRQQQQREPLHAQKFSVNNFNGFEQNKSNYMLY